MGFSAAVPELPVTSATSRELRALGGLGGRACSGRLVPDNPAPHRVGLEYWWNPRLNGAQRLVERVFSLKSPAAQPVRADGSLSAALSNLCPNELANRSPLRFAPTTPDTPLLRLSPNLRFPALEVHRMVVACMSGDGESGTPDSTSAMVQNLAKHIQLYPALREEAYLICIKQVSGNPDPERRGLGMMVVQVLLGLERGTCPPIILGDFLDVQVAHALQDGHDDLLPLGKKCVTAYVQAGGDKNATEECRKDTALFVAIRRAGQFQPSVENVRASIEKVPVDMGTK